MVINSSGSSNWAGGLTTGSCWKLIGRLRESTDRRYDSVMLDIESAVGVCMRRKVMERELLEVELYNCKSLFAASTIGIVWPGGHIGMKKRHQLLLLIEIDSMLRIRDLSLLKKNGGKGAQNGY